MTKYAKILQALRKAGNKGCTVRDLLQFTNYPSARIHEMQEHWFSMGSRYMRDNERIYRHEKEHNGRKLRVYVLRRVK